MAIIEKYNILGQKFGKWTVIDYSSYKEKGARDTFWLCKCECGFENRVKAAYLRNGKSKQCVGCAHAQQVIKNRLLPKIYWDCVVRNAIKRNIEFKITQKQVIKLIKKQGYKCALSGLDIQFSKTESDHLNAKTTASIDRIDSSKSYTIKNIQIVHKTINYMKHTLKQKEFIEMCRLVTEKQSFLDENLLTLALTTHIKY